MDPKRRFFKVLPFLLISIIFIILGVVCIVRGLNKTYTITFINAGCVSMVVLVIRLLLTFPSGHDD